MSADEPTAKGFSLKRWSRRKLEAAHAVPEPVPAPAAAPAPPPAEARTVPPVAVPASDTAAPVSGAAAGVTDAAAGITDAGALPPVESLTIDSDFTAFFQPKVDETLKRQALKQLVRDPRFNVMDGLDVYIDDYSKPDPISPDVVRQLVQGRYIFDPPATRVNERGEVEDVPPDEVAVKPADAKPATSSEARPGTATGAPLGAMPEASPGPATGAPLGAMPEAVPAVSAGAATVVSRGSLDAPVLGALPAQPVQLDIALPAQPDPHDTALPAQPDPHDVAVPAQPGPPDPAPR